MTEHNEEPVQAAVVAEAAEKSRGLRARLDPGWATITAAALALIGTVVTAVVHSAGGGSSPKQAVVAVTTTVADDAARSASINTAPESTTTIAPTTTTTAPTTSSPVTSSTTPPPAPVVQVMSALPADQREAATSAATSILQLANQLPLIVHDEFANNDYAWPVTEETYAGGIECSWSIANKAYETLIHTTDGGAWCRNGLSKQATDFALTIDEQLRDASNSDIGLQFRMTAERTTYYELTYSPQTQTMSLSYVDPNGSSAIIPPVYVADIHRTSTNTVTLLALGPTMGVYINDALAALVSNETRITGPGTIAVRLQLNEANEDELLSLNRYELRGS